MYDGGLLVKRIVNDLEKVGKTTLLGTVTEKIAFVFLFVSFSFGSPILFDIIVPLFLIS